MEILFWHILNVLEVIDCNELNGSAIEPVVLGLLGNAHFFSTGHKPTLPLIQWETAFIPFSTIVYSWSPKEAAKVRWDAEWCYGVFILYHTVVATSAAACAGWPRGHSILHKVFSPRFMLGNLDRGVVLLVVDDVVSLISLGAVRWNSWLLRRIWVPVLERWGQKVAA
ncbi:hypothetical protein BGX38DRAFT_1266012 [Terfezia claveryi]|nr:hypothetical protein BGX38DRAFT_1266012 [Terfezia claveryi]